MFPFFIDKIYQLNGWSSAADTLDPGIHDFLSGVVASMNYDEVNVKVSDEQTKTGELVLSPVEMNDHFKNHFKRRFYQPKRVNYISFNCPDLAMELRDLPYWQQKRVLEQRGITDFKDSFAECDFLRHGNIFEVQFGKYPFVHWDWEKSVEFIEDGIAATACVLVPMPSMASRMSSGVAAWDSAMTKLVKRRAETKVKVPIAMIGVGLDLEMVGSASPDRPAPVTPIKPGRLTKKASSSMPVLPDLFVA